MMVLFYICFTLYEESNLQLSRIKFYLFCVVDRDSNWYVYHNTFKRFVYTCYKYHTASDSEKSK